METVIDRSSVSYPRFSLFSLVILRTESEKKGVTHEPVQIVGMTWNPKDTFVEGWWYHIRYVNQPLDSPWLSAGYQEDCPESDLIHQTFGGCSSCLPLEATRPAKLRQSVTVEAS